MLQWTLARRHSSTVLYLADLVKSEHLAGHLAAIVHRDSHPVVDLFEALVKARSCLATSYSFQSFRYIDLLTRPAYNCSGSQLIYILLKRYSICKHTIFPCLFAMINERLKKASLRFQKIIF